MATPAQAAISGSPSQRTGAAHEETAAQWLVARGFTIVARNYNTKIGELDIVALNAQPTAATTTGATKQRAIQPRLHFVEVRYRKSNRFGGAAASVTHSKRQKLRRTAALFLQRHPQLRNHRAQFDVITITGTNYPPDIHWIEAAF